MKKIIFAVLAMVAIGFSACGNKTQKAEAIDSAAVLDSIASEVAQEDINAISALFESGDVAKLQEALATVKEKIASLIKENPELAKEYVVKVQDFLKENADKVKALAGDSEAAVAVAVVKGLLEQVGDAATEVKDAAVDAANQQVEDAKNAANQKVEETKAAAEKQIEDQKNAAKQKTGEAIDNAANKTKKALGL